MSLVRRWWETQCFNATYCIPEDHSKQQKNLAMSLKTADGFFKVNNFIVYCLLFILQGMTFKKLLKDVFSKHKENIWEPNYLYQRLCHHQPLESVLEARRRFETVNFQRTRSRGQVSVSASLAVFAETSRTGSRAGKRGKSKQHPTPLWHL